MHWYFMLVVPSSGGLWSDNSRKHSLSNTNLTKARHKRIGGYSNTCIQMSTPTGRLLRLAMMVSSFISFGKTGRMRCADGLDDHELLRDVNVYALADYFEIDKLKTYSLKRFSSKINNLWVSEAYPIAIREVYSSIPAKEAEPRNARNLSQKSISSSYWRSPRSETCFVKAAILL